MDVRRGYKQTEVGTIPEDWRVVAIQDIATVGRGRVISHKDIARASNPQYPVYSSQTSDNGVMGYIDTFDFEGDYVTWTTDGENAGTVFARSGRFNATNVCGTIKLGADNHEFVALVLAKFAPSHVSRHVGNPKLMNDIMKRVKIPLPNRRCEQDAIAEALNDAAMLRGGLDHLIAKKRGLKQASMQQLLTGLTRLPGFTGEWVKVRISEISEYVDGVRTSGGDLGYVEIGDIDVERKSYNLSQKDKFSVPGAVKVPAGTLLISTVRPTRGAIAVTQSSLHVSSAFCRLRPKSDLLFHLVCQPRFLSYLGENSIGGTYPTCRDEVILEYETSLPGDPYEQSAIAAVLSDMNSELAALEARRDKTCALREGMMQELLTGRTRLI